MAHQDLKKLFRNVLFFKSILLLLSLSPINIQAAKILYCKRIFLFHVSNCIIIFKWKILYLRKY